MEGTAAYDGHDHHPVTQTSRCTVTTSNAKGATGLLERSGSGTNTWINTNVHISATNPSTNTNRATPPLAAFADISVECTRSVQKQNCLCCVLLRTAPGTIGKAFNRKPTLVEHIRRRHNEGYVPFTVTTVNHKPLTSAVSPKSPRDGTDRWRYSSSAEF